LKQRRAFSRRDFELDHVRARIPFEFLEIFFMFFPGDVSGMRTFNESMPLIARYWFATDGAAAIGPSAPSRTAEEERAGIARILEHVYDLTASDGSPVEFSAARAVQRTAWVKQIVAAEMLYYAIG
jgi:hypothetical protein